MTVYARIAGNVVVELFTPPDGVPFAACFVQAIAQSFVPVPDGIIPAEGWTFDGTTFAAPVPASPPPPPTVIPSTAFLNRFTQDELAALTGNPQTLLLLITCAAAGKIDLADAQVTAGINGLTTAGILAPGRADAILTP